MITQKYINEDMRFLAQSEIRLKILSELYNGPNNIKGLVKSTNIAYSSVASNINKLEQKNHIKKIKNKYHINPMTEIYFNTLMEFKKSLELIHNYSAFWDKHNINLLNLESIRNITDLEDSTLVETTPVDIYKTHNTIKKQLSKSENVKAVFPYLHPEYPQIIENILKNNGSVELIVPQSIYLGMISSIDRELRNSAREKEKLKIHVVPDELNIYLTITDESMSLGLFKNDGSFDQNRILISDNRKSTIWAEELFQSIKGGMK